MGDCGGFELLGGCGYFGGVDWYCDVVFVMCVLGYVVLW